MSAPVSLCPNCKTVWTPGMAVCAHCGYVRLSVPSWPPPPVGLVPSLPPPAAGLVTGQKGGDVALGLAISIASCLVTLSLMSGRGSLLPANLGWGVGLLAPPVLYFVLRPRHPALARGVGLGVLIGFVLLPFALVAVLVAVALGVLALCSAPNGNHG